MVAGRYVVAVLACVGNMICVLGRDTMRLAILPMQTELGLTQDQVSHVLGGYNYGMVVTMLAGGPLADCLGGKWLLLGVALVSCLCTALVPVLAPINITLVAVVQVVAGLGGGLVVPALSSLVASWEPVAEAGRLATVVYTGSQLSAVLTSLVTGLLSHAHSWQLTFYLLGSVPLVWALPWLLLVDDDPARCRVLTSSQERAMLRQDTHRHGAGCGPRPRVRSIPVRAMAASPALLAVIAANMAVSWAAAHTALLLPQFLHSALQLPLHHTGLVSALPYIGSAALGLVSAPVYGLLLRCGLSRTAARKLCSSVCLVGFAVLTLPVPWLGGDTAAVTVLTTLAYSLTGFNLVGAWSSPLDIGPNFVGTIMGVTGLFCYLTSSLVPHTPGLVAWLLGPGLEAQLWPALFSLVAGVALLGNGVYLLLATADTQAWNYVEDCDSQQHLNIHIHSDHHDHTEDTRAKEKLLL